jgi:hypothetical protein
MALLLAWACRAMAADRIERELDRSFAETVHPFLETYCFACHGEEKQKGKLDLRPYSTREAIAKDYRRWEFVLEKLKAEEMPPEEGQAGIPRWNFGSVSSTGSGRCGSTRRAKCR